MTVGWGRVAHSALLKEWRIDGKIPHGERSMSRSESLSRDYCEPQKACAVCIICQRCKLCLAHCTCPPPSMRKKPSGESRKEK